MGMPDTSLFPSGIASAVQNLDWVGNPSQLETTGQIFSYTEGVIRVIGAWGLIDLVRSPTAPTTLVENQFWLKPTTLVNGSLVDAELKIVDAGALVDVTKERFQKSLGVKTEEELTALVESKLPESFDPTKVGGYALDEIVLVNGLYYTSLEAANTEDVATTKWSEGKTLNQLLSEYEFSLEFADAGELITGANKAVSAAGLKAILTNGQLEINPESITETSKKRFISDAEKTEYSNKANAIHNHDTIYLAKTAKAVDSEKLEGKNLAEITTKIQDNLPKSSSMLKDGAIIEAPISGVSGNDIAVSVSGGSTLAEIKEVKATWSGGEQVSANGEFSLSIAGAVGDLIVVQFTTEDAIGNFYDSGELRFMIQETGVITPTISNPTPAANLTVSNLTIASTSFESSEAESHVSSDWQISTAPDFSTLFLESLNDTTNLTSLAVSNLTTGETYYARVRYTGSNNKSSLYSPSLSFNVDLTQLLGVIDRYVLKTDAVNTFGNPFPAGEEPIDTISDFDVSEGGSTIVIGDRSGRVKTSSVSGYNSGVIYILEKDSSGIFQHQKTLKGSSASSSNSTERYGESVRIRNGVIVVGAPLTGVDGNNRNGGFYVIRKILGEWQQVAFQAGTNHVSYFGLTVDITDSGLIAVGAPESPVIPNENQHQGYVEVYKLSEDNLLSKVSSERGLLRRWGFVGSAVAFTESGKFLAIGARKEDSQASQWTETGVLYIHFPDTSSSVRITHDSLGTVSPYENFAYGNNALSASGDRVAVSAKTNDIQGINSGVVYVLTDTSSNKDWSSYGVQTITPPIATSFFGKCVELRNEDLFISSGVDNSTENYVHHYKYDGQRFRLVDQFTDTYKEWGKAIRAYSGGFAVQNIEKIALFT